MMYLVEQVVLDMDLEELELLEELDRLELLLLLSGPNDNRNCYFSIHAGAGGTESCDWAMMLLRMYLRYFERMGFSVQEMDRTDGEEAGVRSINLLVKGPYAYGYLSCEMGVHRLVRISPFDSQHRRHTSFASVDVLPELAEVNIEIRDDDIELSFDRSSGPGGQHVNKTSTAVRILHKATGIVVRCQNERSQYKNRSEAMKMLRAKLYRLEEQKRDAELAISPFSPYSFASSASRFCSSSRYSLDCSIFIASLRFLYCDRSFWQRTTMPVAL